MSGGLSAITTGSIPVAYTGANRLSPTLNIGNEISTIVLRYLSLSDVVNLVQVDRNINQKVTANYFGSRALMETLVQKDALYTQFDEATLKSGIQDLENCEDGLKRFHETAIGKIVKYLNECNSIIQKIAKIFRRIFPCFENAFLWEKSWKERISEVTQKISTITEKFARCKPDVLKLHLKEWAPMISCIGGFKQFERIFCNLGTITVPNLFNDDLNNLLDRISDSPVAVKKTNENSFSSDVNNQPHWNSCLLTGSFASSGRYMMQRSYRMIDFLVIRMLNPNGNESRKILTEVFVLSNDSLMQYSGWFAKGDRIITSDRHFRNTAPIFEKLPFSASFKTSLPGFFHRAATYLERYKKDNPNGVLEALPYFLALPPCKLSNALGGWDAVLSLPIINTIDNLGAWNLFTKKLGAKLLEKRNFYSLVDLAKVLANSKTVSNDPIFETVRSDDYRLVRGTFGEDMYIVIIKVLPVIESDNKEGLSTQSERGIKFNKHNAQVVFVAMLNDLPTKEDKDQESLEGDKKYGSLGVYTGYPAGIQQHHHLMQFVEKLNKHLTGLNKTLMDSLPNALVEELLEKVSPA